MNEKVRRVLNQASAEYIERRHADAGVPINNSHDFANILGYNISRITKSLLLKATGADIFCLVVLSTDKKFAPKTLTKLLKVKHLQIASKEDLAIVVGYPPQGVSPVGTENISVFMDKALLQFPTILIGSGEVATEIEIDPQTLAKITKATVLVLTQQTGQTEEAK